MGPLCRAGGSRLLACEAHMPPDEQTAAQRRLQHARAAYIEALERMEVSDAAMDAVNERARALCCEGPPMRSLLDAAAAHYEALRQVWQVEMRVARATKALEDGIDVLFPGGEPPNDSPEVLDKAARLVLDRIQIVETLTEAELKALDTVGVLYRRMRDVAQYDPDRDDASGAGVS